MELVNKLESAEGIDRDVFLFYVAAVLLHELTHYGEDKSGNRIPGEEGAAFEMEAYGKLIEEKTARELINQYFERLQSEHEIKEINFEKGATIEQFLNPLSEID